MATSVTLEQLPDDVIVMVLQYLPVEDVLACRLVCKRFCGLALHWDVWRHRSLEDDDEIAGAVLRLAPCLDTLTVTGRVPTLAVTTTSCAVASLELHSDYGLAITAVEYALAFRNQESLGRLRKLYLDGLKYCSTPGKDVLVRTIAKCSDLESLEVIGDLPHVTYPVVNGPPRPSLTNFECPVRWNSASFVHTILAGHATTLTHVNLGADFYIEESTTAELLAAMPRLHSLRCDKTVPGLNVVAECKTLRDVSFYAYSGLDNIDVLSEFLRRADQLQRVHLDCQHGGDFLPEISASLIKALTSTGRPHLERLALEGVRDVRRLLRALHMLPALRHLDLNAAEPDDELLKSITPATAPALRLLEIALKWTQCPHAWIHGAAVKATLAENPALHIQLWCRPTGDECDPQDCETCAIGCHRKVKWGVVRKIGLYSHDPDKCLSPAEHTDDVDWQRSYNRLSDVACTWIHA